jgi:hypothetical protein
MAVIGGFDNWGTFMVRLDDLKVILEDLRWIEMRKDI